MGTDNLHHRRKQQKSTELKRKNKQQEAYEAILIICEDSKSGKYYLEAFSESLGLTNITVKFGGTPWPIVKFASKEIGNYDKIYCVFDRDEHADYDRALDKIIALQNNGKCIYAITSIPCFEYWILLHYGDSSHPYRKKGNKSAGDQLESKIKKDCIPDYHKGHKNIFEITKKHLRTAIDNAKRINIQQKKAGTDNPSTNMYELIEYLLSLKLA